MQVLLRGEVATRMLRLSVLAILFWKLNAASQKSRLGEIYSEAEVVEAITKAEFDAKSAEAGDVENWVHKGWHDAVQALVARSQSSSEEAAQNIAAKVRHAVYAEKNRLDDLIRSLDRNYGKAVDVSPAMQWAQNSTHIFLSVKFAQRWNAPGALEVENETVTFSDCCFNFTAFGEHSFIRRRYHLSFMLFRPASPAASSWFLAAAGRMTVMIAKASPSNWPRLFHSENQPKNLGIWRDMREKWKSDLEKFPVEKDNDGKEDKASKASSDKKVRKSKQRKKLADQDSDDDEAVDREVELISECPKSTFAGTSVAELCSQVFKDVVEKPAVPRRRWLIGIYSSAGIGDLDVMRNLMPVWKRLADVFPSTTPGGRFGALDCAQEKTFCSKLGASKLPQLRRFHVEGNDEWSGELDASLDDIIAWGGKSEL